MAPLLLFQRYEGYGVGLFDNIRFVLNLYPFSATRRTVSHGSGHQGDTSAEGIANLQPTRNRPTRALSEPERSEGDGLKQHQHRGSRLAATQRFGGQFTKSVFIAFRKTPKVKKAVVERHFGDITHP